MTTKTLSGAASIGLIAALLSSASSQAFAQDAQSARIEALEAQIAALAAQVADLKESTAADAADIRDKTGATTVSIAAGKPVIASADGAFTINFHAISQLDTANYFQDSSPANASVVGPDLNSGTNFRRARIAVDGKLFRDFDYGIMLDFGGTGTDGQGLLHEAYVQYSGLKFGEQAIRIRGGAFAPNLGLEDAASQNSPLFLERSSSAEIARSLAGADKRIGVQVATNADHWLASVAVTGAKIADGATLDEPLGYTARVAATPFFGYDWRLHVGANASYVASPAETAPLSNAGVITFGDRPELRNDATQLVTTGAIAAKHASHVGVELAFQKQQFLIQSEYFRYGIDRPVAIETEGNPKFDGWYVEGSWLLTGEARKYNIVNGAFDAPTVTNPFDLSEGKWGAWELAARYSTLDLNFDEGAAGSATPLGGVRGGQQTIISAALNWHPNSAVRFGLQYQDVDVDRLNAAGTLQIGQSYSTVALRSQFAF